MKIMEIVLTCPKCQYKWKTKSSLKNVTCSSCGYKVKNIKEDVKK